MAENSLRGDERLGLPLTAVGVLPSVFFWLLTGEARLGASSLLRAVSLPLAPKLGAGAHTAVAATRSACSGATAPRVGLTWCHAQRLPSVNFGCLLLA